MWGDPPTSSKGGVDHIGDSQLSHSQVVNPKNKKNYFIIPIK
jgi:hypothetical protein